MNNAEVLYRSLEDAGIRFAAGVPDSLLNDFCLYLSEQVMDERHVIAANEGNAVAIAAGHYLSTGGVPLVYMQNSGIGNSLNPLISLTNMETYSIPMVLLIGWRGSPGINDWAHHKKQGQVTPALLDLLEIPYRVLENNEDSIHNTIAWAAQTTKDRSSPVAVLVQKGTMNTSEKKDFLAETSPYSMSREDAIACVINSVPLNSIFVATTGRATREVYEIRNERGIGHESDFLNVGAMGHASSIALGLSKGNKDRLVVCLDGDASAIMHLGSFTTIGASGQKNLLHVVLNNGAHESVGGQPTAGYKINFTGIAKSACYHTIGKAVDTEEQLKTAVLQLTGKGGPSFIDVRIRKGIRKNIPPLRISLTDLKHQLMNRLSSQ